MKFKVGFSNLSDAGVSLFFGGARSVRDSRHCCWVGDTSYALGWADSNNMQTTCTRWRGAGARSVGGCHLDTHSTSGKRPERDTLPSEKVGGSDRIASTFRAVSENAVKTRNGILPFRIQNGTSKIRVMGGV